MLTEAQINEIFDQMRATARQLQDDYGNGQFQESFLNVTRIPGSVTVADQPFFFA